MTTMRELNLDPFSERARMALRTARRRSPGPGLDSRHLLLGLAGDMALWPAQLEYARVEVIRQDASRVQIERDGETTFMRRVLSREVETVLSEALDAAQSGDFEEITPEHILYALSRAQGNDATAVMRSLTGQLYPWREVQRHLEGILSKLPLSPEPLDGGDPQRVGDPHERVVAFLFRLLRDDVPFGVAMRAVQEIERSDSFRYENKDAEALVRSLVARLWA